MAPWLGARAGCKAWKSLEPSPSSRSYDSPDGRQRVCVYGSCSSTDVPAALIPLPSIWRGRSVVLGDAVWNT